MVLGKHLNKYYVKYLVFFLLGIAALVVVDCFHLVIPEALGDITQILTDEVDGIEHPFSDTMSIVWRVLIVTFVLLIGRVIFRLTIFYASASIEADLRKEMFVKAEKLSPEYYQSNKVGTIMSWFTNDLETINENLGWGTVMLIDSTFLTILTLVKMFKLDIVLSIITLIPVILIVLWGALVEKWMGIKWKTRQESFDRLFDFSQENFTGIRVIKAFVKENQEIHAFAKIAKKDKDVNVDFVKISMLFDACIQIILSLIICIIMGFGGYFVYSAVSGNPVVILNHEINLNSSKLVTFVSYFDVLIWPLIALGQIFTMRSRCKTSLGRISEFLDAPEKVASKENAVILKDVKGNIRFNHFNFSYPEHLKNHLSDVTIEIKSGETVGIVGKIGCGKTTFVNSLLRLYNYEPGTLFIDDVDIMDIDLKSLREVVSICPQDNFLFSDKVSTNIAFSNAQMSQEDVENAAKFSSVHDDIIGFKDKYDTVVGERGVTLSGGQKQRVSIARAYAKNSPILILDDSVSAVDTKTEETILKNIKEQRKGKTTLIVASRVSTISHLDKILVLDEGKVEGFGTHEELLTKSQTYANMVYLQKLEEEIKGGN